MDQYFALEEECDMVYCFLNFQETRDSPIKMQKPLIN